MGLSQCVLCAVMGGRSRLVSGSHKPCQQSALGCSDGVSHTASDSPFCRSRHHHTAGHWRSRVIANLRRLLSGGAGLHRPLRRPAARRRRHFQRAPPWRDRYLCEPLSIYPQTVQPGTVAVHGYFHHQRLSRTDSSSARDARSYGETSRPLAVVALRCRGRLLLGGARPVRAGPWLALRSCSADTVLSATPACFVFIPCS